MKNKKLNNQNLFSLIIVLPVLFFSACSLFNSPQNNEDFFTVEGNVLPSVFLNENNSTVEEARNAFPVTQSGLTYSLVATCEGHDDIQILDKAASGSFSFTIPAGIWLFSAAAYSGDVELLTGQASVNTDYLTSSVYSSVDIVVFPLEEILKTGTGYVSLSIAVGSDSGITKAVASWKDSENNDCTQNFDFSSSKSGTLTLNSSSDNQIASGSYDVRLQFYKSITYEGSTQDYLLYDCSEVIVVLKDMATTLWFNIGNASYFSVSKDTTNFLISKDCVNNFQQSYLCVDYDNGNDSTNTGSFLAPYKTLNKAISKFQMINSGSTNYLIYLLSDVSYSDDAELSGDENGNALIALKGTSEVPFNLSIKSYDENVKKIDGNRSSEHVGRVLYLGEYVNLSLENIEVTGGYTSLAGSGIYVSQNTSLNLKNTIIVKDNLSTASGTEKNSNLYLSYDSETSTQTLLTFTSSISQTSDIGISVGNAITSENSPYIITSGFAENNTFSSPSQVFSFDDGGFVIWNEDETEAALVCSTGNVVVSNHQNISLKANKEWVEKSASNTDYSIEIVPYLNDAVMSSSQKESIVWSLKLVDKYGGLITTSDTSTITIDENSTSGTYYIISKAQYNSLVYNSVNEIYFFEYEPISFLEEVPVSGTYELLKVSELKQVRDWVKNGNSLENVTIIQQNNLNLNCDSDKRWIPIGNYSNGLTFAGTYDGNNYSIRNFYSTDKNDTYFYPSLFENVSGTIKNLTIEGTSFGSGIAGYVSETGIISNCVSKVTISCAVDLGVYGGIASYSMGKILKCENYGTVTNSSWSHEYIGGICGSNMGLIGGSAENKCTNYGNISNTVTSSNIYCGGIAGYSYGEISYCDNKAETFDSSSYYSAAIVGYCNSPLIAFCNNYAAVTGSYSGGIVGMNGYTRVYASVEESERYYINGSRITDCVNYGTISASSNAGGIVCASYDSITIENCTNEADITASDSSGGIIYRVNNTYANYKNPTNYAIINCVNKGNISGRNTAGGIIGCFNQSSFSVSYTTLKVENCINNGTITTNSTNSSYGITGGIAADIEFSDDTSGDYLLLINNINNGECAAQTSCGKAGGIAGYIKGYVSKNSYEINNNLNTGYIESESGSAGICARDKYYEKAYNNVNTGIVKNRTGTSPGGIATAKTNFTYANNYYLSGNVYCGTSNTYYGIGDDADVSGQIDSFTSDGTACSIAAEVTINENEASTDLKTLLNYWVTDKNTANTSIVYALWDYDSSGLPVLVLE